MGRGTIRRSGSRSLAARLGVGKGVVGAINACLPVSLCVSIFTSAPPPCPQLFLLRIHRPSPGFGHRAPSCTREQVVSPAGTRGVQRPPAGPARRQGSGREGGVRGGLEARETGAWGTLRGPGEGRQAGSMRRVLQGPPREEAGAEPSPAQRTRGRPNSRGRPWGGHREGGCGGGAGSSRHKHLGPGEQCVPPRRAVVPMRMLTALGTHALQCGTPGPAPAPCPGTASRGPWVTGPLLLQRRGHLLVPSRQICQVGGRPAASPLLCSDCLLVGGWCREQSALGESPKWFLVSAWSLTLFLWPCLTLFLWP